MAVVMVQEQNTFLRLVSDEEIFESASLDAAASPMRRAQSVPPGFRAAVVSDVKQCWDSMSESTAAAVSDVKQWSDSMSESTEAPNDSSDLDDLFSFAATSLAGSPKSWSDDASLCGSCDDSPQSRAEGDESPCCKDVASPLRLRLGSSALRLGARRYDPKPPATLCSPVHRTGQANCVLGVLMSYLCSLPVVTSVEEQRSNGGKSVRYLATVSGDGAAYAGSVVAGAQQALLEAALSSRSVYVMGHARHAFTPLGVSRCGFQARLCVADERMCMDTVDYGRCNRWCPRTECRRKHPRECHLTEIVVELQQGPH